MAAHLRGSIRLYVNGNRFSPSFSPFSGARPFMGARSLSSSRRPSSPNQAPKRGIWFDFDMGYKMMEENRLYRLYVVGGIVVFLVHSNDVAEQEKKMMVDELVSLNEGRIVSEEYIMEQGDGIGKSKATTAKDSKAAVVQNQNPLSQAILRLMCGRSGPK